MILAIDVDYRDDKAFTAGYDIEKAKNNIINMHGEHRIPSLLALADRTCRKLL